MIVTGFLLVNLDFYRFWAIWEKIKIYMKIGAQEQYSLVDTMFNYILYFGSAGIIFYDIYCNIFNGASFIHDHLQLPLFFFFLYMTHLAIKNYKKK